MAPKYKDADLNRDGEVSPAERQAFVNAADTDGDKKVSKKEREAYAKKENKPDLLSSEELASQYGYVSRVFEADPELRDLLQKATGEQWSTAKFEAELMATQWWNDNNEYARDAFARRAIGGADWEATVQETKALVQQRATALGARLTEQELNDITDKAITSGWDRAGRQSMLDKELSSRITADERGTFRGQAGTLQQQLRQLSAANGLQLSNRFFESAARSVASGLTDENYWLNEVRSQAASLWPTWSEKIMNGSDAYDLASGYINVMAQTFEIAPDAIDLNDPYIREAMTGTDDKGNPKQLGLWEFQQKLRNDPRWMGTKQAGDEISNIANDVLRMFGFVGA